MTDDTSKSDKTIAPSDAQAARQNRLNAALRANLQKRKQQSRSRAKDPEKPSKAE